MRRNRNAKIVATLGPASSSQETIETLFRAGVDVFRFNFSHGTNEEHAINYETVRFVENKTNRPIMHASRAKCSQAGYTVVWFPSDLSVSRKTLWFEYENGDVGAKRESR